MMHAFVVHTFISADLEDCHSSRSTTISPICIDREYSISCVDAHTQSHAVVDAFMAVPIESRGCRFLTVQMGVSNVHTL